MSVYKVAGAVTETLHRVLGSRAGNRAGVLLYHRVQPCTDGLPEPTFNVTPDVFRDQLTSLVARGFHFLQLRDVLQARCARRSLPPGSVVLTFDDGFESVYHHAAPILQELRIPATVFIATSYIDSTQPFAFDRWAQKYQNRLAPEAYRPLTVDQCRTMSDSGAFDFGTHTHTHQDFRGRAEALKEELRQSADIVRSTFGYDEVTFAFPYGKSHLGYAGGALSQAARDAGVSCALSTDCQLVDPARDDPFEWGRFSVSQWDTSSALAAKLGGWYGWAPQMQQWLDRLRGYDRSIEFDPPLPMLDPSPATSMSN